MKMKLYFWFKYVSWVTPSDACRCLTFFDHSYKFLISLHIHNTGPRSILVAALYWVQGWLVKVKDNQLLKRIKI